MSVWEQAGYCPATDDGHRCARLADHEDDCDFMAQPRCYEGLSL